MISSCGSDAILGQATEAVLIKDMNPELNRKEGYGEFECPTRRTNEVRRDKLNRLNEKIRILSH